MSERHEDGETVYWIEKPGFLWGTRKHGSRVEIRLFASCSASIGSSRASIFPILSLTVLYLPIVRMCLRFDCAKIDGVDGLRLGAA